MLPHLVELSLVVRSESWTYTRGPLLRDVSVLVHLYRSLFLFNPHSSSGRIPVLSLPARGEMPALKQARPVGVVLVQLLRSTRK